MFELTLKDKGRRKIEDNDMHFKQRKQVNTRSV